MLVLLTGVAGFIGSKVAELLLAGGHQVVGVDNLNDAYDPRLKRHRLDGLLGREGFEFTRLDIVDRDNLDRVCSGYRPFDAVINLAARAGVRSSVEDPWVYVDTNIAGTLNLLEPLPVAGLRQVRARLHVKPLWRRQPSALHRGPGHQQAPLSLCRFQERRRGPLLHLPLPARHRRDCPPLLHRLWARGTTRHEPVPLLPLDRRGRARGDFR